MAKIFDYALGIHAQGRKVCNVWQRFADNKRLGINNVSPDWLVALTIAKNNDKIVGANTTASGMLRSGMTPPILPSDQRPINPLVD
jgi:hypothetical protein